MNGLRNQIPRKWERQTDGERKTKDREAVKLLESGGKRLIVER